MSTVRRPRFLELSRVTTPSPTASARAMADTVQNATGTPEREQPYAALGLKPDEYARIREILGRGERRKPARKIQASPFSPPPR